MNLGRLLHTKFGQLLMSVVLGFGLASLFRKVCKNRSCYVFKAPDIKDINDRIYKFDNKCYKFKPNPTKCDPTRRIIDFNNYEEEKSDVLRI